MTKKTIAISLSSLIAGIVIGIYLFFPWVKIAEAFYYAAANKAARNGVYMTVNAIDCAGWIKKEFSYRGISAETPAARVNVSEIKVTPKITSLLGGRKQLNMAIGSGTFIPAIGESIGWTSGAAAVSFEGREIGVSDLSLAGDISVAGRAAIDASKNIPQLKDTDLLIRAPEKFDTLFSFVRMAKIVPVEKVKDGEWRIRK